MKIDIIKILDRGVANQERLWLKVLANTNLQFYVVFATTYTAANTISSQQRYAYWFKAKEVAPGDYVVLYTKRGTPSETKNADGSTTHFLFWGLERTVWNAVQDCAVIFEISTWQTSTYGE